MKLSSVTEVYSQDEDCCGRVDEHGQDITLETCNGGGGSYIVIKTERWALDGDKEIGELAAIMKGLLKRMNA